MDFCYLCPPCSIDWSAVIVDEAHHIYQDLGLRDAVEKYVPHRCRRMLLSDISQSSGREITYPAGKSRDAA